MTMHSTLVSTHAQLADLLKALPEQANKQSLRMKKVARYLDVERPFKVATVAVTGAGKSTLLNAMLARDLVLVKNVGGAATGCALHIYQDIAEIDREQAIVIYRSEKNIRQLISQHFIEEYQPEGLSLPDELDGGFAMSIAQSQPSRSLSKSEDKMFEDLKATLERLVQEYVRHGARDLSPETFYLDSENDHKRLQALTDEGSQQNKGMQRKIGLIEQVDYHLKHGKSNALNLPNNVCLVDLPGLDGTYLHNIIIRQGIEEADAVLFLVHPRRLETLNNDELLDRIGRFVSSDHNSQSAERIFCVVNCKDEITGGVEQVLPKVRAAAHQFLEKTIPGSTQHAQQFIVAAWPALQAQKALRGKQVEDANKYAGIQRTFEIADSDHKATLEESHIPRLVRALNKFVGTTAERQIHSAHQELRYIIEDLISEQEAQQTLATADGRPQNQRRIVRKIFKDRQDEAEDLLIGFRKTQTAVLSSLEQQLSRISDTLCDEIDQSLQADMPRYWKENFHVGIDRPRARKVALAIHESFLGDVEVQLWRLVDNRIDRLAQEIVRSYEKAASSDLAREISTLSLYKIDKAAMEQAIQSEVVKTNCRLSHSARGLAICHLVNPSNQFLSGSDSYFEQNDKGDESRDMLLSVLRDSVRFSRDLESAEFDAFVQTMRSHYSRILKEDCISNLLNLYRYEMIRIEESLVSFLNDEFDDLRDAKDINLENLALDEDTYQRLQQIDSIEQRLHTLRSLKDQLDSTVVSL